MAACTNSNQAAKTETSPATSNPSAESSPASASPAAKTEGHSDSKGGQVVETGVYHLEFVSDKEAEGTHLDFYLQKGDNHETIPDAKVTAQVQMPDGTQKTIPLAYEASGKHYTAVLSEKATGQYQVKVTADVNGEKVNGRFTFKQ